MGEIPARAGVVEGATSGGGDALAGFGRCGTKASLFHGSMIAWLLSWVKDGYGLAGRDRCALRRSPSRLSAPYLRA